MKNIFLQAICFSLCILFFYAASMKALEFGQFMTDIAKSPLLANIPPALTGASTILAEVAAAMMLALPATRKAGLYLSAFLMLSFTAYMSILYFFYENIPCSCGGILGTMGYPAHIVFNTAFTLLAITGILLHHFSLSYPSTKTTVR
ncbi:MauE/DoxX family redox-associated membrane protein [Chitinophaga barathri]|uniref:Methylamine utilisation protein MauE domain-containing protein n=1 Tax=Chitinophaga barathri TaxID=1647451 RepID=A0A3N4MGK9_9BACT|nr:MauE/DoxX family redox-associated membrane protein [Chitinophaga barathri]RPD39230.1 hypothetical protein EG028_21710 [Chitinophaga barathri]